MLRWATELVDLRFVGLPPEFGKDLPCGPETTNSSWKPAIDRRLKQNLADFLLCTAVVESSPYMDFEFVGSVKGRQHGEVDHAADLAR